MHVSAAGKLMLAALDPASLETWLRETTPRTRFTSRTLAAEAALRREVSRVRRAGFAELVDELEEGLTSLSAPIRSETGSLAAMIGVSGPTARLGRARRAELRGLVVGAARQIEQRLG